MGKIPGTMGRVEIANWFSRKAGKKNKGGGVRTRFVGSGPIELRTRKG